MGLCQPKLLDEWFDYCSTERLRLGSGNWREGSSKPKEHLWSGKPGRQMTADVKQVSLRESLMPGFVLHSMIASGAQTM